MGASFPLQHEDSPIEWKHFNDGFQQAIDDGKIAIIDCYTDWCGWCKRMDAATFQQPYIAAYLNANYYPVKFNAEQKTDINFKGKTYTFIDNGKRGYHELAAAITKGMLSYPTVAFLDEQMNVIQAIKGYKDPLDFEQIMTYFGGDFHKKMPWEKIGY